VKRTSLAAAIVLAIAIVIVVRLRPLPHSPISPSTQDATPTAEPPGPSPEEDVRALHQLVGNFLTAVKDPYRPPLGDNEDLARAMMGGNRYGHVFVPTNDARVVDGKIVDRWGTPYFFHNRAPDAIDVRSAGPDRALFTADDVTNSPPL
jgi:hypothetical protein